MVGVLFPCPVVSRNTLMEICGVVIGATSISLKVCDFQTDSTLAVCQRSEVMHCSYARRLVYTCCISTFKFLLNIEVCYI